ncbi:MAG: hypothetical protein IJK15_10710 [Bacteroidaceae bacterium]|nr:hypothetical protein [Bacteroidaceae bacterium]
MNEPKISITVMPGGQLNEVVKEQHNYFGTVQQITKVEAREAFYADASEAELVEDVEDSDNTLKEKIASCFVQGLLVVNEPSQLYFLLLAMWARKLLKSKEIPAFVLLVSEAYPAVVDGGRTKDKIQAALYNMNKKASGLFFDTFIKDQSSMIDYIKQMYPTNKDGSLRKECLSAIDLARKLHMNLGG